MQTPETEALDHFEIVESDPRWPLLFDEERNRLEPILLADAVEHIGSTAVPGLAAKPILDMMASVPSLPLPRMAEQKLEALGYAPVPISMRARLMYRRRQPGLMFHLHLVESDSWQNRHERLLRDYLRAHPAEATRYAALKRVLARDYAHDSLAYTRGKTDLIQEMMDRARAERGLPSIQVWEE